MTRLSRLCGAPLLGLGAAILSACSSESPAFTETAPPVLNPGPDAAPSLDTDSGVVFAPSSEDPASCEEAKARRSYVGCDFWPTIVANNVWSVFDFAVVVANVSAVPATVEVTGPGGFRTTETVAAGASAKLFLPWVTALKGEDWNKYTWGTSPADSAIVPGGAYHLTSSVPVMAYQYNALEYGPLGGPAGKDWSACPGYELKTPECFSYSNDASLLAPTTAWTSHYRVLGTPGGNRLDSPAVGSYVYVTASSDDTEVVVEVSPTGSVLAGGSIAAAPSSGTTSFRLNAGGVARVQGAWGKGVDLSGTLIRSTAGKPIQVVSGITCIDMPSGTPNCDHIEEAMFPAETLGARYVVARPTGPRGGAVGHVVRMVGNANDTTLTYVPKRPAGCPATLSAGQVVDCGVVNEDFVVSGNKEFLVGTFLIGASAVDPSTKASDRLGDPSQSLAVAVEQYRSRYVFLAPSDYDVSYVDVVAKSGTSLTLDGAPVAMPGVDIGDGYVAVRIPIPKTGPESHTLSGSLPFGAQVLGYGVQTSYHVPAGVNLGMIAPPPPPK